VISWPISLVLVVGLTICTSCIPGELETPPPMPILTSNGQALLAWGRNTEGQLGNGSLSPRLPLTLIDLRNISDIRAGGNFSLALTADGRVLEWGGGKSKPAEVPGLTGVQSIAVGTNHRLILKDGFVWAWGANNHGQLGIGNIPAPSETAQVKILSNVVFIAASGDHSLAIRNDNSVWSWGENNAGQLGDGTKITRWTPVEVPGIKAVDAALSPSHTVVLTPDGEVKGWGSNSQCQLGLQDVNYEAHQRWEMLPAWIRGPEPQPDYQCPDQLNPIPIYKIGSAPGLQIKIAATEGMTLVVQRRDPHYDNWPWVYVFGNVNENCFQRGWSPPGMGGNGTGNASIPDLLDPVKDVVGGANHALLLTDKGEVWSVGSNIEGQLGLGSPTGATCGYIESSPGIRLRGVTKLAGGYEHSLALLLGILNYSPSTLDFGDQPVGNSNASPLEITVSNTGLAPVNFVEISVLDSGDYSVNTTCPNGYQVLYSGKNCKILVKFSPTTPGKHDAKIKVTHSGIGSPQEIALTGNGTEAHVTFSPAIINFGDQAIQTTSTPQTVTIQNDGIAPLRIEDIETTANFTVVTNSCPPPQNPIPSGGTCTVEITFTPNVAAPFIGELVVTYTLNKKATLKLSGTGK
jgi:alpha-tubulin suppressor-like RCC1 family protein